MAKNYLLYGRNILREAISLKKNISEIFVANDSAREFVESELKHASSGWTHPKIHRKFPKEIESASHQGVAFHLEDDFYLRAFDFDRDRFDFILLCNHLEDAQNLGALVRSAAAFGVGLIVHEERRSVRLTAAAVKVSAGQAFRMKFLEISNLNPFAMKLSEKGYSVAALSADSPEAVDLFSWDPFFPVALIVGSESAGVSRPLLKQAETILKIPMNTGVESLNAATAGAIAMSWIGAKKMVGK